MNDRSLPITHVISVGNQAVLEASDYIEPLLEDNRVKAIGFYIEGLNDINSFSKAAVKALEFGKPLVILKSGVSAIGTQLTMSHTSSLAGEDDIYQAMFDRFGILRVHSLSELVETLKLVSLCPTPSGQNIGVLTCSGGDSAMLADALDASGLQMPKLSKEQINQLDRYLPAFATRSNPLDYNTSVWGQLQPSTAVFSSMMADNFDVILLALDFPRSDTGDDNEWQIAVDALIAAKQNSDKKAIAIISNFSELIPVDARQRLVQAGIAPLQGLHDGVAAISQFIHYSTIKQNLAQQQGTQQLIMQPPNSVVGEAIMIDEWESKQLLARYGLPLAGGKVCQLHELADTANRIGYPVVVKVVSNQLAHKTEAGAVELNLCDTAAVTQAGQRMYNKVASLIKGPIRFLVEPMVNQVVGELIIGIKRDPLCGPVMVIGTGGILVNLLNDSATLLLPTQPQLVRSALMSLKGIKLLQGYRNKPIGDLDAVIDAAMAVAHFSTDYWEQIHELDINPLMVLPKGSGVVAVDALIRLVPK